MTEFARRYVGSWTCPSANSVDVFLTGSTLACEWDRWPLSVEEAADWTTRILPEVTAHVAALLGKRDPALVIQT